MAGSREDLNKPEADWRAQHFVDLDQQFVPARHGATCLWRECKKDPRTDSPGTYNSIFCTLQTLSFQRNMCDYCYTSMKPPLKEVDLCCFILLTASSATCSHGPSVATLDRRKVKTLWLLQWIDRKSVAGLDKSEEEAFAQLLYPLFQLWNMISISFSNAPLRRVFEGWGGYRGMVMETEANISRGW